ncbi:MAG: hypothetical protein NVS2B8_15490 [Vulcanimicrobiaceae bacterium]
MSVNLPAHLIDRVRRLGFHEDLSASSIVEQALLAFLDDLPEAEVALLLRERGAKLRRGA